MWVARNSKIHIPISQPVHRSFRCFFFHYLFFWTGHGHHITVKQNHLLVATINKSLPWRNRSFPHFLVSLYIFPQKNISLHSYFFTGFMTIKLSLHMDHHEKISLLTFVAVFFAGFDKRALDSLREFPPPQGSKYPCGRKSRSSGAVEIIDALMSAKIAAIFPQLYGRLLLCAMGVRLVFWVHDDFSHECENRKLAFFCCKGGRRTTHMNGRRKSRSTALLPTSFPWFSSTMAWKEITISLSWSPWSNLSLKCKKKIKNDKKHVNLFRYMRFLTISTW